MKKHFILLTLLLAGCSQLPTKVVTVPDKLSGETPVTESVADEVPDSATTQAIATDFEHIFIDSNMTFTGTLPCADCPGIAYHLNLYRDGRFEIRQEYQERNQVNLLKGSWLLEQRKLYLVNQESTLPNFQFLNNQQLTMLDLSGNPIHNPLYRLTRQNSLQRLDTRLAMLGQYSLEQGQAVFTLCQSGTRYNIANTQHHLPVIRQYQQDIRLKDKTVIATLTGRIDTEDNTLYIDQFEQFWPNTNCPDLYGNGTLQGIIWRAEKVADRYIPQQHNVRVVFDSNNKLYGFSGCNNFNAAYQQNPHQFAISDIASTRKFCTETNQWEQAFTRLLQDADRAEINGNKLMLFKENQLLLQFIPALN